MRSLSIASAVLSLSVGAPGQTPRLLRDINETAIRTHAHPGGFAGIGPLRYFAATTWATGRELFVTLGSTASTRLVADVRPGRVGSNVRFLTMVGTKVFFNADDGEHGAELWQADSSGARLVRDIKPGLVGSSPTKLTTLGSRLLFVVREGPGAGLWRSDGTRDGTQLLVRSNQYVASDIVVTGNYAFFGWVDGHGYELWRSDGTTNGTRLVKDIHPSLHSYPNHLTKVGNRVFFTANDATHGTELWVSDGTAAGTRLTRDLFAGATSSNPIGLAAVGSRLFFSADDGTRGFDAIYTSDGTSAGTRLVKDTLPATRGVSRNTGYAAGNRYYWTMAERKTGTELWSSDGTASGTGLVKDINPGPASTSMSGFAGVGNRLFFAATTPNEGFEPWVSDGTAAGTRLLRDLRPGPGQGALVNSLTTFADHLGGVLFSGWHPLGGAQLFKSDGTASGTSLVKDLSSDPTTTASSLPSRAIGRHGTSYFSATDSPTGRELWKTDGTSAGTKIVADIHPGPASSSPLYPVAIADTVFFSAVTASGRELWKTDGTANGTKLVKDIFPGGGSGDPTWLTRVGDQLFFVAVTPEHLHELWKSDGTASGTTLVKDIAPGRLTAAPAGLFELDGRLLFHAKVSGQGRELWRSDGTAAGTIRVLDIRPGALDGIQPAASFVRFRGRAWFAANDGSHGEELWSTDGTKTGTRLFLDITRGAGSSAPGPMYAWNDRLWFSADDARCGFELWSTNGSVAGTAIVRDIVPGKDSSFPSRFIATPRFLFFAATTPDLGFEPWRTDGSSRGTLPLGDIAPGKASGLSGPDLFSPASVGHSIYFAADPIADRRAQRLDAELWRSDGTPQGTRRVHDINPGRVPSSPGALTLTNGRLLFAADDGTHGHELWTVDLPGASSQSIGIPCRPVAPTLHVTPPVLGRAAAVSGTRGPAGHVGIVLLGAQTSRPPRILPTCRIYIDLQQPFAIAGVVATSRWSGSLGIPRDPMLAGTRVMAQTIWLDANRTNVIPTNGVLLTLMGF